MSKGGGKSPLFTTGLAIERVEFGGQRFPLPGQLMGAYLLAPHGVAPSGCALFWLRKLGAERKIGVNPDDYVLESRPRVCRGTST